MPKHGGRGARRAARIVNQHDGMANMVADAVADGFYMADVMADTVADGSYEIGTEQPHDAAHSRDAHDEQQSQAQDGNSRDQPSHRDVAGCAMSAAQDANQPCQAVVEGESDRNQAAWEIHDLCKIYRKQSSSSRLISGHDAALVTLHRKREQSNDRLASPAAAVRSAAVLHDDDVVPWLHILHCSRSRVASKLLLKEFVLTLAFTCVYLVTLNMQIDAFSSYQVSGPIRGQLVDGRCKNSHGDMKGFFDINSYFDWYEWASNVLVAELYGSTEHDYSGRPTSGARRRMFNWQNRIIGGITVLQQRSLEQPCHTSAAGSALRNACTSNDNWDNTRPYGRCNPDFFRTCTADNKFGTLRNISVPEDLPDSVLDSSFYVQLGPDESTAMAQLEAMQAGSWIDSSTRRIQVYVHVWNLNIDVLQSHEMTVVFFSGGLTRMFFTERHTKSEHYNVRKSDQLLRVVLEAISVAFLFYFVIIEIQELYFSWRGGFFRTYWKSGWNMVDLLHCAVMSASVISWILFIIYLPHRHFLKLFDADDDLAALDALALLGFFPRYDLYVQLSGATIFFNLLKMLKSFRFHLKASIIVNTLANMASPLCNFVTGLAVIFFAFVYIAHVDFGPFIEDWYTISFASGSAVTALFQSIPLSDIDTLPDFARYYFYWQFGFVIVMNFIMLNLIVAIIIEGYMTSIERRQLKNYTSQRMVDQFLVGFITILVMPFAALPNALGQGLHLRLSGIFGRRLQVHYSAPSFFLGLFMHLDVPQHNHVSFRVIWAEIEKHSSILGDQVANRGAVTEMLLHFMESIDHFSQKSARERLKASGNLEQFAAGLNHPVGSSNFGSPAIQLRDEAVLMLRSHARTLQRHSDSLHAVSHVNAFPLRLYPHNYAKSQILLALNEKDTPSARVGPVSIFQVC